MLRFLSRRKVRNNYADNVRGGGGGGGAPMGGGVGGAGALASGSHIKPQRIVVNKNKIDCRVILLDNTDLSIELSVSTGPILNYITQFRPSLASLVGICLLPFALAAINCDCWNTNRIGLMDRLSGGI